MHCGTPWPEQRSRDWLPPLVKSVLSRDGTSDLVALAQFQCDGQLGGSSRSGWCMVNYASIGRM